MSTIYPITVLIVGGLGNQLFQIFATMSYALDHNLPFVFPYSEISPSTITRYTFWDTFLKELKRFTETFDTNTYSKWDQGGFPYKQIPFLTQPTCLTGYYQTHKYFEKNYEIITKLIKLREQQEAVKEEYKKYFETTKQTISMHFRMGDYKGKEHIHPIMPIDYYFIALNQFDKSTPYRINFFCEKEDKKDVFAIISALKPYFEMMEFVHVENDIPDYKQMLLMSICDHNIIANSTFSWWGAYFNSNADKKVMYPSIWFGPWGNAYVYDLFPTSWKKIDL